MLVGRDHELQILTAQYEKMLAGNGSVLFLTGEAGLGKTTLVHEWWASIGGIDDRGLRIDEHGGESNSSILDHRSAILLESACSIPIGNVDVGRLEALQPWAHVIAQLQTASDPDASDLFSAANAPANPDRKVDLKKLARDSAGKWALAIPLVGGAAYAAIETRRLVKLQRELSAQVDIRKLVRDAAPAWAWALPFVGDIAHAAAETARLAHEQRRGDGPAITEQIGSFAQNQEQVFQQYVNLLTKVAATVPLVVFLDDLHWADSSSCNLLFHLARQISRSRILLIGTYRSDEVESSPEPHPVLKIKNEILRYEAGQECRVRSLSATAVNTFLHSTFEGYERDDRFERWLHHVSGGNALFLSLYVRNLRDEELITERGQFRGNYDQIAIPSTAYAVVEERIRRLEEPLRDLLRYATAEGEEFTSYVLGKLADTQPLDLLRELKRAEQVEVVRSIGATVAYADQKTMLFRFAHALVHKALYDGLNEVERDILHTVCFAIMKEEWDRLAGTQQRTTKLATKLLTHAEYCRHFPVVADVALHAARDLWKSFNEVETLAMCRKVVELPDHTAYTLQIAEARLLMADIASFRGRGNEGLLLYHQAEQEFRAAGNPTRAIYALNGAATVQYTKSEYADAIALSTRAMQEARGLACPDAEGRALTTIGNVHADKGEYATALHQYTEALGVFERSGNRPGEGVTLGNIGILHKNQGEFEQARSYFLRAIEIHQETGNRRVEGNALTNLGNSFMDDGRYDEALEYHRKALVIHESIGNRLGEAATRMNIGVALWAKREFEPALDSYNRALAFYKSTANRRGEAYTLLNIGGLYREHGDIELADSILETAEELAGALALTSVVADIRRQRALIAAASGDRQRAIAMLSDSVATFVSLGEARKAQRCRDDLAIITGGTR